MYINQKNIIGNNFITSTQKKQINTFIKCDFEFGVAKPEDIFSGEIPSNDYFFKKILENEREMELLNYGKNELRKAYDTPNGIQIIFHC